MNKLKTLFLFSLLVFLFSCTSRHSVLNPKYDLTRIERIGIVKFDSHPWGIKGTEDIFAKYLIRSRFTVVERGKIDKVLNEYNISARGYLAPETTKLVGKILGVDALLMGNIVSYTPARKKMVRERKKIRREVPVYETKIHKTPSGNEKITKEKVGERVYYDTIVTPRVHYIYAEVGITAKLVDVETAEIIWVGSYSSDGRDMADAIDNNAYYLIRRLMKDWKKSLEE
jgi:curli biogenesis system outer membrane secretion channel CsgG